MINHKDKKATIRLQRMRQKIQDKNGLSKMELTEIIHRANDLIETQAKEIKKLKAELAGTALVDSRGDPIAWKTQS